MDEQWRAVGVLVTLAFLPWTFVVVPGTVTLVFPWGMVDPGSPGFTDLVSYLTVYTGPYGSLPRYLRAWPMSTALYLGAVASALAGAVAEREDVRVTVGLLVLAAVTHAWVAIGLTRGVRVAFPVGSIVLGFVAWWRWVYRTR